MAAAFRDFPTTPKTRQCVCFVRLKLLIKHFMLLAVFEIWLSVAAE